MSITGTYYVYIYTRNGIPFYVGKGQKNRFMSHIYRDDFPDLSEVTVSFKVFPTEAAALDFEAHLISKLRLAIEGGCLLNKLKPNRKDMSEAIGNVTGSHQFIQQEPMSAIPSAIVPTTRHGAYEGMGRLTVATGLSSAYIRRIVELFPQIRRTNSRHPKYHLEDIVKYASQQKP